MVAALYCVNICREFLKISAPLSRAFAQHRGLARRFLVTELTLSLLLAAATVPAQEQGPSLDDLMTAAEQWANENLDPNVLQLLQGADEQRVGQMLTNLQKQFQGDYVLDLAALKDAARAAVPLLENYEETLPYALWLKTRLDYLDVADDFRRLTPPPKVTSGQTPRPVPNPTPQKERDVWTTKLSKSAWPENAKTYVPRLKPIFTEENVPPELVWVAEVESSFDPRAKSPAGAAGLFQLMPATAQRYGLRTTWLLDQRVQPEPSARAAAQYLHFLHTRFKDWRLALAAYNAGEGRVQELLTQHKARTYDAIATYLPAETQMYVPKVEATVLRREGVRLSELKGKG
jgi:membrane-bound lytic murein transglycosylase D